MKKTIGATVLIGAAAGITPLSSASADQSIVLEDVELKGDRGVVLLTLKEGEVIETSEMDSGEVFVEDRYSSYKIDPEYILTVSQTEETNWKTKEDTLLYMTPDIFSSMLGSLPIDEPLVIVDDSVSGWLQVSTESDLKGWVHLSQVTKMKVEKAINKEAYVGKTQEVKDVPLFKGDKVQLTGYEKGDYLVVYEDGTEYRVPKEDITDEKPSSSERDLHTLFEFAQQQLAKPYVWGGNGIPGYDCSGYTKDVYAQIGIDLPRTAATQSNMGVAVSLADLAPGDMMFFETYKPGPSHVAIYMGDGKMIHAAGKQVHIADISETYWSNRYLFTRRVM